MSAGESLVLGDSRQLALLEPDDAGLPAQAYELGEQAGRFTGERIFSTNPKLYRAIVALLARAVPYREISEICSVSVNTVCAVSQREGEPIETIRQRIGRMGMNVAALTLEAIMDMLADPLQRAQLSIKDLAVCHGIAFTNAQLALGGATSRMEAVGPQAKPTHEAYLDFIRNVTATGSRVETPGQKELQASSVEVIEVPALPVALAVEDPAKGAST